MPNNRNTENITEHPWLDAEDWEIALEPYEGNPDAALVLGVNFAVLRSHLSEWTTVNEAIAEIDRAMSALFLHTHFHKISYVLFRQMAEGKLSFEQQTMLKTLGVKL